MTASIDLWTLKEGVSQMDTHEKSVAKMDTPEIRYVHFGTHPKIILYIYLTAGLSPKLAI